MKKYFPDIVPKLAIISTEHPSVWHDFIFLARQEQSVFFPENYYAMLFDKKDGTILFLDSEWDGNIQFAPQKNIIDMNTAMNIWQNANPIILGYVGMPIDTKDGVSQNKQKLLLAYCYEFNDINAIDAATGKLVRNVRQTVNSDDLGADTITDKEMKTLSELSIYNTILYVILHRLV